MANVPTSELSLLAVLPTVPLPIGYDNHFTYANLKYLIILSHNEQEPPTTNIPIVYTFCERTPGGQFVIKNHMLFNNIDHVVLADDICWLISENQINKIYLTDLSIEKVTLHGHVCAAAGRKLIMTMANDNRLMLCVNDLMLELNFHWADNHKLFILDLASGQPVNHIRHYAIVQWRADTQTMLYLFDAAGQLFKSISLPSYEVYQASLDTLAVRSGFTIQLFNCQQWQFTISVDITERFIRNQGSIQFDQGIMCTTHTDTIHAIVCHYKIVS